MVCQTHLQMSFHFDSDPQSNTERLLWEMSMPSCDGEMEAWLCLIVCPGDPPVHGKTKTEIQVCLTSPAR